MRTLISTGSRRARLAGALAALTFAIGAVAIARPTTAAGEPPMYLYNLAHTGFEGKEKTINAGSVGTLAPAWIARATETVSGETIAANGLVYWGSWDGLEHATDPATGTDVWTTYLGQETKEDCTPPHLGVASTATVVPVKIAGRLTQVLYVGGGDGSYHALNASTGEIIWSKSFGSPADGYFMWSSPSFYKKSVYVGVSSIGDCPLVAGQIVKLNAASGALEAQFETTPPGCPGAGPWTSSTIDKLTGTVYMNTGTDGGFYCGQPEPYAQALLELTANLELKSFWKPPPEEQVIDGDFGATPTLFMANVGGVRRKLVGSANKNGVYYALERGHVGDGPVWQSEPIATETDTIATSAWDGKRLYVAGHFTKIKGKDCEASIRAINPENGSFLWSDCLQGGAAEPAVTAVPGVVFESLGSILYGLASKTGQVLFEFQDTSFHWFFSPAMVHEGALYIGNSDGNMYKFTPFGQ
jgi:outer membrane protein assembly factor BamB